MSNTKRVRWLERAYKLIRQELLPEAPARACVSVSITTRRQAIGQHFLNYKAKDGNDFIAIHPKNFTDPVEVLRVETHEMIHTIVPLAGHGKEFRLIAKAIGFTAPWKQTPASKELQKKLQKMSKALGPLPRAEWLESKPAAAIITLECVCPRVLTVSPEFNAVGHVKCMKCKTIFRRQKPPT
jgi:hypothetical protein